jgi:hypothetical protein
MTPLPVIAILTHAGVGLHTLRKRGFGKHFTKCLLADAIVSGSPAKRGQNYEVDACLNTRRLVAL